ncbi:protein SPA, chloroplastic isoform X3 [Phoenix dactylifera]|uniref:Protein SPA, chloroplastic isoform X3 n=1 Tax=Phoenix dactylifera TaxID=42345 RepID=A0A8B8ZJ07_PHODC|nr:protein SPA, chloroplastic isoform X3 [Phoenix dactylifera]
MAMAPLVPSLRSSFLLSSPQTKLSHSFKPPTTIKRESVFSYPRIRALELDQNTAKRENTQPCFPCNGSGAQQCRFCTGTGNVTVVLGGGETEVSRCINCEGAGTLTCTTCQGTGIQPRYLDRREFKDDD